MFVRNYLAHLWFLIHLTDPCLFLLQGTYTVLADVYTVDDEPITCLTATVSFKL